jgi:hypothetical protein
MASGEGAGRDSEAMMAVVIERGCAVVCRCSDQYWQSVSTRKAGLSAVVVTRKRKKKEKLNRRCASCLVLPYLKPHLVNTKPRPSRRHVTPTFCSKKHRNVTSRLHFGCKNGQKHGH